MYTFNKMATFDLDFEKQSKVSRWLDYSRKELPAENFDLDQFLADHDGEYNIFINGGCNCRTGEGSAKCIAVYKEHSIMMDYVFPVQQTSAVSAIVSGLLEVFRHLKFTQKNVNIIVTQEMGITPCGNQNTDQLKVEFCKLCEKKEFVLTLYRLRGEAAANTIRQIVGMPQKQTKKFSKVRYTGTLSCLRHLI